MVLGDDDEGEAHHPGVGSDHHAPPLPPPDDSESDMDDDEIFEAAVAIMERHRADTGGLAPFREKDFQAVLRFQGDSYQGQVKRGGHAQQWCIRHGFQQTKKFPTKDDLDQAKVLASAWAHRMQYIYDASEAGLMDSKAQAEAAMQIYDDKEEPADFVALMAVVTGENLELGRLVRSLKMR